MNKATDPGGAGGASAGAEREARPDAPALAVVSDLFFVARIRETGRLAGVPVEFARTPEQVAASLARSPRLVLVDLTAGFDYESLFGALERARPPVLGFTTHALARQTLKSFTAKVTAQALQEVGDLIESGHLTPVIDRTYPLTDAAAAVRLVEEGSPAGKVIVVVEPPPPEPPPR